MTIQQEKKIEELLSQMTLEEKVGQMNQMSPSIVGGFEVSFTELIEMAVDGRISHEEFGKIMANAEQDYHEDDIRAGKIGSCLMNNAAKYNDLQKIAVEESRLGIPLIIGFDVIHGFRTVFPIPIAQACMFEDEAYEKSAKIAAAEAKTQGIRWSFAPMLDIARDARWGRVSESAGEDPYLMGRYGAAMVKGFQSDDFASCLKHFVGYGAVESGKDYNTVSMSPNMLYNVYLPPFQKACEAGALTAMAAFNDINGVPCTSNNYLLRNVLKERFGLKGFVVSDANAVVELIPHGIARDRKDASVKAFNAGMDMDMGTGCFVENLEEVVKENLVSIKDIDDTVRRILTVKMEVGLFDKPYLEEGEKDKYQVLPKEHLEHALDMAKKSLVLLKNDNILPLKKDAKIALVGELADKATEVLGSWAIAGRGEDCITIKAAMENRGFNMVYEPCCGVEGEFDQATIDSVTKDAEVIIAVVGEYASMSGEASSRADISLPGKQREFLEKLIETGKPVVACLMNGRPLALKWENENIPAILECWHLGVEMGNAVTDVLFGDYNPSGKLAVTFPSVTGQCPMYYNRPNTGRPASKSKFTSRYLDAPNDPEFCFGYGLSYTSYEYKDLIVEENKENIKATVSVTNTGKMSGTETVQLYMRDVTASIVRPVKELKGYEKVSLNPGETKEVVIKLDKKDMGFYNDNYEYCLEDGIFHISVGTNVLENLTQEIEVKFS